MSKNNSERVGIVLDRIIGPSDSEVIVDQVSNLSAAKETVLFLGLLFLQIESPFEQNDGWCCLCWSNPNIKYCKIRHWNTTNRWRRSQFIHWINQLSLLDPLHSFRKKLWTSTYLSLEFILPASKRCWCREFVEMMIRNLQSLLICFNCFKNLPH